VINLWTIANLLKLNHTLRKKIVFYAPLLENLDFMGIDPCTFTRVPSSFRITRDGFTHTVGPHVPRFQYSPLNFEVNLGLALTTGETLRFAPENMLHTANTLIWFEDRVPKSIPTQLPPINSNGFWLGNLDIHVSHICKANAVLSVSEINTIQAALLDVPPQVIPVPIPPVSNIGTFVSETPSGSGSVFTLSQNPNLNSLVVSWAGLFLMRVASAPAELQYTASGVGNRTITLGSTVTAGQNLNCQYVTA
jgi:hypothetical protein